MYEHEQQWPLSIEDVLGTTETVKGKKKTFQLLLCVLGVGVGWGGFWVFLKSILSKKERNGIEQAGEQAKFKTGSVKVGETTIVQKKRGTEL